MRYLFLFTLCFIGFNAYATSEQYTLRTEFTFCKYNDGKGQDDVVEFEKKYEKFLRKNGLKYSKAILTPILAGETDYDFVLWGTWPNGQEMYKEYGAFINDYKNTQVNPSICNGAYAVFNTGARHLRIPREEYDKVQFVEFANCKFTKDASFKELLKISAEQESLIEEFGYKGFGVHYLRPYRGFDDDFPYDMIRMAHWYNRDKRAENIEKNQAMNKFLQSKGIPDKYAEHIESCGNRKVFGMEQLYAVLD
tara:strand:+ start:55 stop:807 length:753 start_codon:yes stop_codon:yes gene_type:complete